MMSVDTDYLNLNNFKLSEDQKLELITEFEYQKDAFILFVKDKEDSIIRRYKETLSKGVFLSIIFLTDEIKDLINKSKNFIINGHIIRFKEGFEVDKVLITKYTTDEKIEEFIQGKSEKLTRFNL